jgi:hypothetical protein
MNHLSILVCILIVIVILLILRMSELSTRVEIFDMFIQRYDERRL